MEVKIDQLIEKIRQEGVETARQNADEIVANAKKEAAALLDKAKKDADNLVQDGKKQTDAFQKNAELAIQQAARDSELLVKTRLNDLFDQVFKSDVGATLTPDFLQKLIQNIVDQWGKGEDAEILVNDADQKSLEALLKKGVNGKAQDGIVLKVSDDIAQGFRIGVKGEDVYYDFTDETIAQMLKSFLNPKLKEILERKDG